MFYLCERNCDGHGWGAGLTPRNSHQSVTVSMTINAQPARLIDENLLCVSSINIWLKRSNSRHSPLCLSDGDEFAKGKFKAASYLPRIHSMSLPNLIRVLCFLICIFFHRIVLYRLPWNSSFWGRLLDFWIKIKGKSFHFKFCFTKSILTKSQDLHQLRKYLNCLDFLLELLQQLGF